MLYIVNKEEDQVVLFSLTVTVDFVHILRWNADDAALLDDFGILPYD